MTHSVAYKFYVDTINVFPFQALELEVHAWMCANYDKRLPGIALYIRFKELELNCKLFNDSSSTVHSETFGKLLLTPDSISNFSDGNSISRIV